MMPVFEAVLPIFLLIVVGGVVKRGFIGNADFWGAADKLVYYLFFPALLLLEVSRAEFSGRDTFPALAAVAGATTMVGLLVFAGQVFVRVPCNLFTSIFQGGVRYNSYVFMALSQSLFGEDGVALSGVFVAYMIVLTNVMSVMVMNLYAADGKKSMCSMLLAFLRNPLIVGALIGLALNLCKVGVHGFPEQLLRYLGNAATPLSLMSVGAGLVVVTNARAAMVIMYASSLKLLVLPAITFAILKVLGVSGVAANVALLYATVPCAGNAYILARQMGGDHEAMASIITWTTVGSSATITAILSLALA